MINVLHVAGIMNRGGLETFVMNVFRSIDSRRFHCDVLCTIPGKGDYDEELSKMGAKVFNIGDSFQSSSGKLRFINQYRQYKKWFSAHSYDVIHIHGSHAFDNSLAVEAALKSGCSTVICHSHTNDGDHKRLNATMSRLLCKRPIVRIACSEQAGEWLFGPSADFEIIKNGIDVDNFSFNSESRKRVRAEFAIPENARVIVHTGRLVAVKNQSFLLDVFSALQSSDTGRWLLFLIGEGQDRAFLENKVAALGLENSVHFLGLREDVARLLSAADIYIMPSLHEGLPLAVVEAQANGLPVLISSGVSPETKLLNSTRVLALDDGCETWARMAEELALRGECTDARVRAAVSVKSAGFDISQTVNRLQTIYKKSHDDMDYKES